MDTGFRIFEGDGAHYAPIISSNQNIKRVCEILTQSRQKDQNERVYYAQLGDISPSSVEEDGTHVYEFKDVYKSKIVTAAALAQVLFIGAPKIVEIKNGVAEIVDEKINDTLIRSEVWRAFEMWLGKFGENPYEVKVLLTSLVKNPALMNTLMTMQMLHTTGSIKETTSETPNDGSETSSS